MCIFVCENVPPYQRKAVDGGLADDVGRQKSGEKLVRFLARDALSEQHEHRVGTSDSAQHHVGVAHVDVVCQTGGIAVSGLDTAMLPE